MNELTNQAELFINKCYKEIGREELISDRLNQIKMQIRDIGTYEHTYQELEYGAKVAWRNSNKCIGRLFWDTLQVIDKRSVTEAVDVFQSLDEHLIKGTNGGKIRPTITVFSPRKNGIDPIRIWNHQLIRYAGYETHEGILGDPMQVMFTKLCERLGWRGEKTPFDILPYVIQCNEQQPVWRNVSETAVFEVSIEHPEYEEVKDLQIKWYAVPAISDMMLEIGGIQYPAAPFNGWYMGTEIGARNLADESRYHYLPKIASIIGLDTTRNSNLWKDRALVELNRAVLFSFQKNGVSIVDHHTAAEQFKTFEKRERESNREVTGRWSWLIPPVSPATTHVFHKRYNDEILVPNYFHQDKPY